MFFTKSHQSAHDVLITLGHLFFQKASYDLPIKPRLMPLVVGPTGVGKSFLVEQVAGELNARYFKVTRGDWIPQGARTNRPTVFQIIDHVLRNKRVLLHIDELDKFQIDFSEGDWSASIGSDLWNVLDGKYQFDEYIRGYHGGEANVPTPEVLANAIGSSLWIVGSGTWQDIFVQSRRGATAGFGGSSMAQPVNADSISGAGVIPEELLYRFNSDLIFLGYPSIDETVQILTNTGLSSFARDLGVTITPSEIDWTKGGMRVLETLMARLAVKRYQRTHSSQPVSKDGRSEPFDGRPSRRQNGPVK